MLTNPCLCPPPSLTQTQTTKTQCAAHAVQAIACVAACVLLLAADGCAYAWCGRAPFAVTRALRLNGRLFRGRGVDVDAIVAAVGRHQRRSGGGGGGGAASQQQQAPSVVPPLPPAPAATARLGSEPMMMPMAVVGEAAAGDEPEAGRGDGGGKDCEGGSWMGAPAVAAGGKAALLAVVGRRSGGAATPEQMRLRCERVGNILARQRGAVAFAAAAGKRVRDDADD